jgi:hypothetical protein
VAVRRRLLAFIGRLTWTLYHKGKQWSIENMFR